MEWYASKTYKEKSMRKITCLILFWVMLIAIPAMAAERQTLVNGDGEEIGTTTNPLYIDIQGDLVLDDSLSIAKDLTVDTNTFVVDSSNNRVGIGTATPGSTFTITSTESYTGGGIQAIDYTTGLLTTDANTVGVADFNYLAMNAGTVGGGTGHQIASLDYAISAVASFTQAMFASESRMQIEANAAQATYGDIDLVHVKSDNATNINATGLWIRGEAYAADDATPKSEGTFTPLVIEPVIGFDTVNAAQLNCNLTTSGNCIVGGDLTVTGAISGDGYTLQTASASVDPIDSTDYYTGSIPSYPPITTASVQRVYVPIDGTIKRIYLNFANVTIQGSAETSTTYLLLNNTDATTISSSVTNDSLNTVFNNTSLSIAVDAGDYFEIKWTTPAWATNPTGVVLTSTVYIERR